MLLHHAMDFFQAHPATGWLILVGLAVFPRITLLFVGGPFGVLHWLGWVFAPHLLVAILATSRYWDTNPVLCAAAWFIVFAGTGGETGAARRGWRWRRRTTVVER
ncbi:MAG: hypothetical protein SFW67_11710 [Myxococcaceae bacterium]|nr:hypothetical protein [Myxococcaceae bacterium]